MTAAMEPASRPVRDPGVIAGRVVRGLVVLALAADAAGKLIAPAAMRLQRGRLEQGDR